VEQTVVALAGMERRDGEQHDGVLRSSLPDHRTIGPRLDNCQQSLVELIRRQQLRSAGACDHDQRGGA
jgi:hypothetical protein